MADYSGAYEKIDYSKEKKVGKHSDHIQVAPANFSVGTFTTSGANSSWGYDSQITERIARKVIKTTKTYDSEGKLICKEREETIEYISPNPFMVTNVTQSSSTGELE